MVDRNQAAREREQAQRELSQQLQKFARQLSSGQTGLLDRFGIKLTPGDYVTYRSPSTHDLIFEILDIVPILDMSRPPGHLTLKLSCTTDVEFVAGQRGLSLIRCGEKSKTEAGMADIQPPHDQVPAGSDGNTAPSTSTDTPDETIEESGEQES